MDFTKQQTAAITSRDKNLLVAAAAGSGKTAVLVERIIQLITTTSLDIDKMLIVTFTNAAANEMRARIHKAIAEQIATTFDTENLERQQILLSGASIMTFHSFCLSVLRRHFAKINLDPKFREADEHELNIIKQDVIADLFEQKYQSRDPAFLQFTDEFGGTVHGDSDLHKLIINLHKFAQSRPYPKIWLESLASLYENPATFILADGSTWLDAIINFALAQAKTTLNLTRADCRAAKIFAETILRNTQLSIGIRNFEEDSRSLNELARATSDWNALFTKIRATKFDKFDGGKKIPSDFAEAKEKIHKRRNAYRDKIEALRDKLVTTTTDEIIAEMKSLASSVRQLVDTTLAFDKAFAAAKRERNIIDFDDMEHLALEIFDADTATATAYREKFRVIMVDEYQDTNGVQEEIISRIVSTNNFFAVGDVKQSIYRFRNAEPEIFLKKYLSYPSDANSERVDLSKNFRSRSQIVNAVNAVFENLMTAEAAEIDYDADARLNFGADYPAADNTFNEPAELCIINLNRTGKRNPDDADDYAPDLDRLECEIQLIADKINAMKGRNIRDGKIYRPIEFRDIVILFRSMDGTAAKIVDVLRRNNIPAYAADKNGYFNAPEIQTIINLLKILDNARQDIPLAAVMLSPIGGFSAEDLARLRISDRTADLYTLVSNDAACQDFLAKINRWREMAYKMSVPELLNAIYRETGYYDYFSGRAIPQANLRMLIDRAAAYEKTAFRGLSRFIQFIKKIRELGNDLSAARTLSESENVVRVMTIHKSKGLEFPVVFVAGLGKKFNLKDLSDTVIPHRDLGIGIYRTLEGGAARVPTFARRIIARKARNEMLAEELRILYVAFTRAREKLILVASVNNASVLNKYDDTIPSTDAIQSATRPLDWLLMVENSIGGTVDVETFDVDELGSGAAEVDEAVADRKIAVAVDKPDAPTIDIPAKLSVTEIKRRLDEDSEMDSWIDGKMERKIIYRRPAFLQKSEMTAAEFGTAMHSVMQHLNLAGDLSSVGISVQIDEMVARQILNDEQAVAVKRKVLSIENFFTSEIGKRIIFAQEIYRELPFNQIVDAGDIFSEAAGERVLVQGIIDLLFKDSAGNWVLLDYKTDRNNTDEHFRREYRRQIEYYVRAVEALARVTVSERYLYLLGAGRLVKMESS